MAVSLPIRNLLESRIRLAVSIGGVSLSLLLVLVLNGIVAGSVKQVTAYIERTPTDLIISQKSVKSLHMTTSFFPSERIVETKSIPGVRNVSPILYITDYLVSGNDRSIAYIIGYFAGSRGGPGVITKGNDRLGRGEIIIDERIAANHRLGVGDEITTLGHKFAIAGFTKGTVTIVNSTAFISYQDFEQIRKLRGVASYGFVELEAQTEVDSVKDEIAHRFTDITVQTKTEFIKSEQRVVSDMSADIMRIMNFIALLIGLAALGLTVYTATLAKIREYGVLKALGIRNVRLFANVFMQALMSVALGLVIAVILVFGLSAGLALAGSNILVLVELSSIINIFVASSAIAVLSAAIPIALIARLDPADVFRR